MTRRLASAALCVLGGALLLAGCGAAPASPSAKLYVAPGGTDSHRCTRSQPCASIARALGRARPGQVIQLAGGSYPSQTLPKRSTAAGPKVVIQPAASASVRLRGELVVYASNVEIRRIDVQVWKLEGARNVDFRGVHTNVFFIHGGRGISIVGGDVGPSTNVDSQIASGNRQVPRRIRIVAVRFHDAQKTDSEAHVECLQVGAARGLLIRGSSFRGCADHAVFVRSWGGANGLQHPIENVRVEGNVFESPEQGTYSLRLAETEGWPCREVVVRGNIALGGMYSDCDGSSVRFERNAMPRMNVTTCQASDATWDFNLYGSGVPCGPHDRVAPEAFEERRREAEQFIPG